MISLRQSALLALADALALTVCAVLSWWVKSLADPVLAATPYLTALPVVIGGMWFIYTGFGLYPGLGLGAHDELKRASQGLTVLLLAAIAVTFLSKAGDAWSRQILFTTWGVALVCVPLARVAAKRMACRTAWWGTPCVILGAGATGMRVADLLRERPWLGLRPVAILDDDQAKHGGIVAGLRVTGPAIEGVARLACEQGIRHAVLAMPGLPPDRLSRMIDALGDHIRHVYIAPALPGSPDLIAEAREFANTMVLEVHQNLLQPLARVTKRSLDLALVTLSLLLFSWLFAALALVIMATSRGPVFYGQTRIGRGGREFMAWKFRSMVKDADAQLNTYLEVHPELREEWERDHKLKDDPRVTWIGRLLRRTSLDELPQLWNILRGDMSLVGPRPIVQDEVAKYGERFALFCKVRPGLSGLWQVSGRNDTTYAERVALDCYYVRNWSVWLDLVILARTVRVVLLGKGAY